MILIKCFVLLLATVLLLLSYYYLSLTFTVSLIIVINISALLYDERNVNPRPLSLRGAPWEPPPRCRVSRFLSRKRALSVTFRMSLFGIRTLKLPSDALVWCGDAPLWPWMQWGVCDLGKTSRVLPAIGGDTRKGHEGHLTGLVPSLTFFPWGEIWCLCLFI